jgi:hypothetical protein
VRRIDVLGIGCSAQSQNKGEIPMRSIRSKLTYANVMVTILAFIVLGGGAAFAASKLAKNSVGTKQIKNGAVTSAKVKKHTLTGTNINLAKLGTVPSARNAATATTATTAGTANALAALEPIRLVGTSGQPSFLDGSSNVSGEGSIQPQPVGFYKDHEGIVHLEGIAKVGKEGTIKGLIFALPPGYRPPSGITQIFEIGKGEVIVFGSNVTVLGQDLSGDVYCLEELGHLSGITFRAGS